MGAKHRGHILLESEQHRLMTDTAQIDRLTQIRKRLERQHGILQRDLLTEAREEREADLEHVIYGRYDDA